MDLSQLKFRHLYGELYKTKYENIQSSNSSTESCGIKGNPLYCAFPWKTSGGGALTILHNNKPHKLSAQPPLIIGHQGAVLDFDFSPFNDSYIATASEDSEIRLWDIPDEFKEDLLTPLLQLQGHSKKVSLIHFNQSTANLLASTSYDKTIKIWNLEKQDQQLSINEPEYVLSLQWNYMGDLLGCISKNKHLRILDPRLNQHTVNIPAHDGPKTQKFTWLGNTNYCLSCGFSKKFERQFKLWDLRSMQTPIQTQNIDSSAGTIYPFYDMDTQILFLAGKGDGNIRFYEFCDGQFFACSNTFQTSKPGMAYGFYSKRSCNVLANEIMRGLKLTDYTVEYIKFCAPRKSEAFQSDLFPDTISNIPAQNAEQWFDGANNQPIKMSLNPANYQNQSNQSNKLNQIQNTQITQILEESMPIVSMSNLAQIKQLEDDYHALKFDNKQLKEKTEAQKGQLEQLEISLAAQHEKAQQIKPDELALEENQKKILLLEQEIQEIMEQHNANNAELQQLISILCQKEEQYSQASEELPILQERLQQLNKKQIVEEEFSYQKLEQYLLENEDLENKINELNAVDPNEEKEQAQEIINLLIKSEESFIEKIELLITEREQSLTGFRENI